MNTLKSGQRVWVNFTRCTLETFIVHKQRNKFNEYTIDGNGYAVSRSWIYTRKDNAIRAWRRSVDTKEQPTYIEKFINSVEYKRFGCAHVKHCHDHV